MKKKVASASGPTRVIAYIRVSTEKQADKGNSLEAQKARLEAYAVAFGLEVVGIETDAGESAGSLDRPGLQRALASMTRGEADGLLVMKLDRLTRSLRDLNVLIDEHFKDGGKRLMSASEQIDTATAAGRMMLNILTAVAQWEREAAAERTAAVMAHLKDTGKFTGGWPPFGYSADADGNLIECPAEQAILIQAKAFRQAGMSIRSVAAALPVNPRTGKPFGATQIARMM